jgi:hypothetical protein
MKDRPEQVSQLASLFEKVTGETSVTERQEIEVPVRYEERAERRDLAEATETAVTAHGFEDVIDQPQTY